MMSILVVIASLLVPTENLPCTYLSASQQGLHQVQACASVDKGKPVLAADVLSDLQFDQDKAGLAQVQVNNAWHWVRENGDMQAVLTFDNGADPFSEGFTRGPGTQGIAYYDRNLIRALDLPYAWGMPFEGGYALVCKDCVESKTIHEHRELVGTTWGVIDHSGKGVITPALSLQQALSQRDKLPRK